MDAVVNQSHDLDALTKRLLTEVAAAQNLAALDAIRVSTLGKKGEISELMKQLGFASSTSEARRLLGQGAVRVDGRSVTDVNFRFVPGMNQVIEVGKRRVARIER